MRALLGMLAVLMLGIVGQASGADIFLGFDSPVPGTINDTSGLGTGFTDRLPGTGGSLPTNDPNLDISAHPGYLAFTSTNANLIDDMNIGVAEAPGVFVPGAGKGDIAVSVLFHNIQFQTENQSDQLMVYAGVDKYTNIRVGFHHSASRGPEYMVTIQDGYRNGTNVYWQPGNWTNGDDVLVSLTRSAGQWRFSWDNKSNGDKGSTPLYSFPALDNTQDLYFGLWYSNRLETGPKTSQVDWFHVVTPEPNSPPFADAGPDQELNLTGPLTEAHLDGSNSYDPDEDPLTFEWSVAEGSGAVIDDPKSPTPTGHFPLGPTLVTLTVCDGVNPPVTDDVLITVQDKTAPALVCTTNKATLWPPNHHLEQVIVYVQASDNVTDPDDLMVSATVRSNEPDDATGDGKFTGDVNGKDGYKAAQPIDLTFDIENSRFVGYLSLRAERDGGQSSRSYSIVCQAVDGAGNLATASCVVLVPHDQKKK